MSCLRQGPSPRRATHLKLFDLESASTNLQARWKVNGHRLCLHIWTPEEWARLDDQPTDAQRAPCGLWLALRPED